jgi:hypothetical protein
MTVSTNAKDMDASADVTNDSDSDDGKMETDEDVGNKMDADEETANNDGEDMDADAGVPKDSGGNDGETEMETETDEDMEIPGLMNQPTDTVVKKCTGWTTGKYDLLFQHSFKEHIDRLFMNHDLRHYTSFPLASRYQKCCGLKTCAFTMKMADMYCVVRSVPSSIGIL